MRRSGRSNRLSRALGGDAYLEVQRGNLHYLRKDLPAAKAAFRQAASLEPTLADAYLSLLRVSLEERDHVETARLIALLDGELHAPVGDLAAWPGFEEYKRSDAYLRPAGANRAAAGEPEAIRTGGDIPVPEKVKDVLPEYPPIARAARVQGAVILECTVAAGGAVTDARVVKGVPLLDAAAIAAVRQWVYKPTIVNGVAVPATATVTVTFSLQ